MSDALPAETVETDWLTTDAACAYAGGITRKQLYRMIAEGMRVYPVGDSGRRYRFNKKWIDAHYEKLALQREARRADASPLRVVR